MDAKYFFDNFKHLAEVPNGIKELRNLITQLAIQGKLVESNTDTSARALIAEVAKIKNKLFLSKDKKNYIGSNIENFKSNYPDHWQLAMFGDIWQLVSGRDLARSEYNENNKGIPYVIGASNFNNGNIEVNRWTENPVVISKKNDLLITCKGTIGKIAFNEIGDIHIARQIMAIRNFSNLLNSDFLKIWLESYIYVLMKKSKGIIPGFSREDLISAVFPVPPLEEQLDIVFKFNNLMGLCDTLEVKVKQKRLLQNTLRKTTLLNLESNSKFSANKNYWDSVYTNFKYLFSNPNDLIDLKNLILNLAVKGKLVLQDSNDEPASVWLSNIIQANDQSLKQKKLDKDSIFLDILEDQYIYDLPNGWVFSRLGKITKKIGSGSTPRGGSEAYVNKGVPFLRSQNIHNNGLLLDDVVFISADTHEKMKNTVVKPNDLLLNITGASIGRCSKVPTSLKEANVSQHVTIIRLTDLRSVDYIHLCILSPYIQQMIAERQVGMAREGLSKKVLEQFEIPLPPIDEQLRIVQRVSELMLYCDALQNMIKEANTIAAKLVTSAFTSISGISTVGGEGELKAPRTELVSIVKLGSKKPNKNDKAPLTGIIMEAGGQIEAKELWVNFNTNIDTFYSNLKREIVLGWIAEPDIAEMLLIDDEEKN